MRTVKDVSDSFKAGLADVYDPQEIESVILLVLSELLQISKAKLKAFPETSLTYQQAELFTNILEQLRTGKPVQYILGHTEFYGLDFKVSPSVLIPRPETEELVQWVIDSVKETSKAVNNLLDIGTGSGCIPISIRHYLPNLKVFSLDISTDALIIARSNAKMNNVDVDFIHADILNLDNGIQLPQFDIIISNPPYVTQTDKLQMHRNVTDFEPHMALFVPENDPLLFYNAIADFAKEHLNTGGWLFFEINESLGKETVQLLKDKMFTDIELRQDMSGRDRMIKAVK